MSAHHEHRRPSFGKGDVEKSNYDEKQGYVISSEIHPGHDASTVGNHGEVGQVASGLLQPITQPITRERTRNSNDLQGPGSHVLSAIVSRISTRRWPEPPPPPDGGFQAWLQVACGWLALFVTWGYLNSFGSFQTYYEQTMPELEPSVISWIGSLQMWLTTIGGVFTGRLLDAGFFVPTFFVGATLQVSGMFLMSICTQYWQLMLTQGFLTGLGGGLFFSPTLALVSTYFDKHRGFAMGIVTTGNAAGGMIYPIVVRQLMPKLGFAWTTRVIGFITLGALTFCAAFMRPRLPPRKSGPLIDWSAFREPVWNVFILGWWLLTWVNYYTFYYVASYGTHALGMPFSAAAALVIVINGAALPFRALVPLLADRVGPLTTIVPVTAVWAAVAPLWLAVAVPAPAGAAAGLLPTTTTTTTTNHSSSYDCYYAWTAAYGALSGAFQSLVPTAVASITPRLDMAGTRMGMGFGLISVAAMTGPPVGGALQQATGGAFVASQAWAAAGVVVACGLCMAARCLKAGRGNWRTWC